MRIYTFQVVQRYKTAILIGQRKTEFSRLLILAFKYFCRFLLILGNNQIQSFIMRLAKLLFAALPFVLFVSSCGEANHEESQEKTDESAAQVSGEDIYKRKCVSCHMGGGDGIANVYPPLAGSDYLANKEGTILQVLAGSSGEIIVNGKKYNNTMPPQQLNDNEVAAVLTYVYNNMGNKGGTVTAEEVKAVRAKQ